MSGLSLSRLARVNTVHGVTPASECCRMAARDPEAVFCGECGTPLLRCAAHEDCGGLVDQNGFCPECFALGLFLDGGAMRQAKLGAALALPFILRNANDNGRAVFITGVHVRQGNTPRRTLELAWERIDSGQSATWMLQTAPLEQAGNQALEIIIVASSRARWREETFAFVATLDLSVEDDGGVVINQTINVTQGGAPGALGNTIYAPIRIEGDRRDDSTSTGDGPSGPSPLALMRADSFERSQKLRGMASGARVSRLARVQWRGFLPGEAASDGPILTADGMLSLGRARTKAQSGSGDVRLLVRSADGTRDDTMSEAISRRHADLFIQNGRLCVRAAGGAGLRVADQGLQTGEVLELGDGDRIHILPRHKNLIALDVSLQGHHGEIDTITLTRVPFESAAPSSRHQDRSRT